MAADRALAERLSWNRALPLHLAVIHHPALKRGPYGVRPRADGADWGAARDAVLLMGAVAAHAEAVTLARRAETATAAARLRTRDEGRGLALILADESVAAWRMAAGKDGMSSERAARRRALRSPTRSAAMSRATCWLASSASASSAAGRAPSCRRAAHLRHNDDFPLRVWSRDAARLARD